MRLSIPEILTKVSEASKKQERIDILKANDNPVLREILKLNFDPAIKMPLPEGPAPFKTNRSIVDNTLSESNLYNEARRLYLFNPTHPKYNPNVKPIQRENIWIQMLEGCHWSEGDLLNLVKDKQLAKHYKGLTLDVVREAFPGLIPESA